MALKAAIFLVLAFRIGSSSGDSPKTTAATQVMGVANNPNTYNKNIMPHPNKSGPLQVKSSMFIRNINIDELNMKIVVDLTFRMHWHDHRLSYSVGGVPSVRFSEVSSFWIPDAFFKDSSKTQQMVSVHPESYIQVTNKGDMVYSTRMKLHLHCPMNLKRFPHDTQTCIISFGSYGYSTKDIVFSFDDMTSVRMRPHPIWSARFANANISNIDTCNTRTSTGEYSCLRVDIHMERDFCSYLFEWYFPCLCFVIIAFLSEILSPASVVPRLILTVGPLLTLTVSHLVYTKAFPPIHYVTAFDLFTGMSVTAIFATVVHAIVDYYYTTKPKEEEEEVKSDLESATKLKKIYGKMKEKSDLIIKAVIIGGYCAFIFLYMLAYGLS